MGIIFLKEEEFLLLLLKRMKYLTPEEIDQVNVMLATSEKLQKAYMLKEKFYNFVDSSDLKCKKRI